MDSNKMAKPAASTATNKNKNDSPKPKRTTYRMKNRFVFKHPNGRYFIVVKGERDYVTWKEVRHGMGVMRRTKEREEKRVKDIAYDKAYRKKKQIERVAKRKAREARAKVRRAQNRKLGYYY
jgi:hypothetical protein